MLAPMANLSKNLSLTSGTLSQLAASLELSRTSRELSRVLAILSILVTLGQEGSSILVTILLALSLRSRRLVLMVVFSSSESYLMSNCLAFLSMLMSTLGSVQVLFGFVELAIIASR